MSEKQFIYDLDEAAVYLTDLTGKRYTKRNLITHGMNSELEIYSLIKSPKNENLCLAYFLDRKFQIGQIEMWQSQMSYYFNTDAVMLNAEDLKSIRDTGYTIVSSSIQALDINSKRNICFEYWPEKLEQWFDQPKNNEWLKETIHLSPFLFQEKKLILKNVENKKNTFGIVSEESVENWGLLKLTSNIHVNLEDLIVTHENISGFLYRQHKIFNSFEQDTIYFEDENHKRVEIPQVQRKISDTFQSTQSGFVTKKMTIKEVNYDVNFAFTLCIYLNNSGIEFDYFMVEAIIKEHEEIHKEKNLTIYNQKLQALRTKIKKINYLLFSKLMELLDAKSKSNKKIKQIEIIKMILPFYNYVLNEQLTKKSTEWVKYSPSESDMKPFSDEEDIKKSTIQKKVKELYQKYNNEKNIFSKKSK